MIQIASQNMAGLCDSLVRWECLNVHILVMLQAGDGVMRVLRRTVIGGQHFGIEFQI
jgi:hypothetical protein